MSRTLLKTSLLTVAVILFATFSATAQTPVARHGKLKTYKGYLMDEHDKIVQLRGMSFFWSKWEGPQFYTEATLNQLVDNWKCTVVRVAYANGNEGWSSCQTVIDAAIKKGIYVIIDWHSHNAHEQEAAAVSFFTEKAKQYLNTPNVIFEPYNEPITVDGTDNGDITTAKATWAKIKPYLTNVTKAIRATGSKNLIILGTPYYSQYVTIAASDPVEPSENVAYAFHFYAASHGMNAYYVKNDPTGKGGEEHAFLRDALGKVPIFVTEWGTSHSNGGGEGKSYIDEANTNWWFDTYINGQYKLSHCNWSACAKNESSAAFSGGGPGSPTQSGTIAKRLISSPTTDSYDPPWVGGDEGPAGDSVFTMPNKHAFVGYNKYYGGNFSRGQVLFAELDKVDAGPSKNRAITVAAAPGMDWVSFDIDATSATKSLIVRYLAPEGTGTIDVALDGKDAGKLTLAKTPAKTWTSVLIPLAVSAGKHTITFTFTGATGSGYKIEWFELTTSTAAAPLQAAQPVKTEVKILVNKGVLSADLPGGHHFSTYSLVGVDGRIAQKGVISGNATSIRLDTPGSGTWFLKINGSRQESVHRIVVGSN